MRTSKRGFSMIEVLIASAILVSISVAVTGAMRLFLVFSNQAEAKTQAVLLIEEGGEALQSLRDESWDTHIAPLSLGEPYFLYWDGEGYILSDTEVLINGTYRREVVVEDVRRNGSDVISDSGTVDPETREAVISVYRDSDDQLLGTASMLIHHAY